MAGLRFLTAGESHGPGLTIVVEGLPAGLELTRERVDANLARRQLGYGRGGRMTIEQDRVEIRGGVRHGSTIGGPVALWIVNRDHQNWLDVMSPDPTDHPAERPVHRPRPGHADLAGALKLGLTDARDVLERASARETAARVAAGSAAQALLAQFGIEVRSHTVSLGSVTVDDTAPDWSRVVEAEDDVEFRCTSPVAREQMHDEVDRAAADGDTLGGELEVVAHTPPPGLGHFAQWDRRLDGRIGQAMLSIPAAKAVAIGSGFDQARHRGSRVHDEIQHDPTSGFQRSSNRAGGLEGGVTNGEDVRVRLVVKPLSTLRRPLRSADLRTGERADAAFERSDVTVVPAAGVVAEAMLALVLADALMDKCGGDSLVEMRRNFDGYIANLRRG